MLPLGALNPDSLSLDRPTAPQAEAWGPPQSHSPQQQTIVHHLCSKAKVRGCLWLQQSGGSGDPRRGRGAICLPPHN